MRGYALLCRPSHHSSPLTAELLENLILSFSNMEQWMGHCDRDEGQDSDIKNGDDYFIHAIPQMRAQNVGVLHSIR